MEGSGAKLFSWHVTGVLTAPGAIYKCSPVCQMEVVGIPFKMYYKKLVLNRLKSAKVTDKRIRVMNEIISGMRLIKMYAWEWAFHEYVKNIRKLVSVLAE